VCVDQVIHGGEFDPIRLETEDRQEALAITLQVVLDDGAIRQGQMQIGKPQVSQTIKNIAPAMLFNALHGVGMGTDDQVCAAIDQRTGEFELIRAR
jgi:hypothetical protein